MNENSSLGKTAEIVIFALIVLVVIQTMGEEVALLFDFHVSIRKALIIASFGFDVVFTLEFITRVLTSGKKRKVGAYLAREGGIIDFFSSLPLLILSSGPLLFMTYFTDGTSVFISLGSLSFLKIIKIMRVVRIFRFLRILKVLGKTKNSYAMTPKFVALVLIIAIAICVVSLIGFEIFENGRFITPRSLVVRDLVKEFMEQSESQDFSSLIEGRKEVLFVTTDTGEVVYRNIDPATFTQRYLDRDYFRETIGGYQFYFDNMDVRKLYALIHILIFSIIVLMVIFLSTVFRRAFNKHVTSVLNAMIKGFTKEGEITPIRIKKGREDYEAYRLADQYNRKWLAVKGRILEIRRQKH
jgi:hypothetical protein